jgi:hypothetical protein
MGAEFRPTRLIALAVIFLVAAAVSSCASVSSDEAERAATEVMPFSGAEAGGVMPKGWTSRQISRFKKDTRYRLVADEHGVTVVEAKADAAASGLVKTLNISPTATPWIQWRWRVPEVIATADNTKRDLEDSPVRVIVTFDGDLATLDFEERALSSRLKALTGRPLPYATLMYIWENQKPAGEIIDNSHSTRVKMIVVESGAERRGKWLHFERNIAADFERAFGEKPGRINSLGIMTDTDNTGESTVAYYGDIRFSARPKGASGESSQAVTEMKESLK